MSNGPFDRRIVHALEKPSATDINLLQSQADATYRHILGSLLRQHYPVSNALPSIDNASGFVSDGFVPYSLDTGMFISISAGYGLYKDGTNVVSSIDDVSGLDDLSSVKPLVLSANQLLAVAPANATMYRIDSLVARYRRDALESSLQLALNPATGVFDSTAFKKTLMLDMAGDTETVGVGVTPTKSIALMTGVNGTVGAAVAPSTPTGYVKIGEVVVDPGVVSIARNCVNDTRPLLFHGGVQHASIAVNVDEDDVVTVAGLCAPPGLAISARVEKIAVPFSIYAMITCGNGDSTALVTATMSYEDPNAYNATTTEAPIFALNDFFYASVSPATATSADQAKWLIGSPPVNLAVGQKYHLIGGAPYLVSQTGGVRRPSDVSYRVTFNFAISRAS